jgi:hypothetical protein
MLNSNAIDTLAALTSPIPITTRAAEMIFLPPLDRRDQLWISTFEKAYWATRCRESAIREADAVLRKFDAAISVASIPAAG